MLQSSSGAPAITFVPAVIGALVTGLAVTLLLPSISRRSVGVGNAILAAFDGATLPLIAGLVVMGSAVHAWAGSVAMAGAGTAVTPRGAASRRSTERARRWTTSAPSAATGAR